MTADVKQYVAIIGEQRIPTSRAVMETYLRTWGDKLDQLGVRFVNVAPDGSERPATISRPA